MPNLGYSTPAPDHSGRVPASYTGVDGCRGGWVAVTLAADGSWRSGIYTRLQELWEDHERSQLILIDMPIGLAEGSEGRLCDSLARNRLKPGRASSIFPAPVREVLEADEYAEANRLQRQLSGKGLSRQTWGLVPKIRELDGLMQRSGQARVIVRESHPELCFAELFGGPMRHSKREEAGFAERMSHLGGIWPHAGQAVAELLERYPRRIAARDDIVDAIVLAVTAWLSEGLPEELPAKGDIDRMGLRRTISFVNAAGREN
ncbi:DUF429 domain-containing protein [Paenibacillus filicis]|uniref:DUF429 domain-containing protein n=1 Tax=Paenibacillus filicis TaxID=669464 RepID=UPI00311A7F99